MVVWELEVCFDGVVQYFVVGMQGFVFGLGLFGYGDGDVFVDFVDVVQCW